MRVPGANGLTRLRTVGAIVAALLTVGWGAHTYLFSTFFTVSAGEQLREEVRRANIELTVLVLRTQLKLLQGERFRLILQKEQRALTDLERQRLADLDDEIKGLDDELLQQRRGR